MSNAKYEYRVLRSFSNEYKREELTNALNDGFEIVSKSVYVPTEEKTYNECELMMGKDKNVTKVIKSGYIEYILRRFVSAPKGFDEEVKDIENRIWEYAKKYIDNEHTLEMLYGPEYGDLSKVSMDEVISKIDRLELKGRYKP